MNCYCLPFDFLFYLFWVFICAAKCLNHTGKDNPSLLSGQVLGKIGNCFNFEERGDTSRSLCGVELQNLTVIPLWDGDMESQGQETCQRSPSSFGSLCFFRHPHPFTKLLQMLPEVPSQKIKSCYVSLFYIFILKTALKSPAFSPSSNNPIPFFYLEIRVLIFPPFWRGLCTVDF